MGEYYWPIWAVWGSDFSDSAVWASVLAPTLKNYRDFSWNIHDLWLDGAATTIAFLDFLLYSVAISFSYQYLSHIIGRRSQAGPYYNIKPMQINTSIKVSGILLKLWKILEKRWPITPQKAPISDQRKTHLHENTLQERLTRASWRDPGQVKQMWSFQPTRTVMPNRVETIWTSLNSLDPSRFKERAFVLFKPPGLLKMPLMFLPNLWYLLLTLGMKGTFLKILFSLRWKIILYFANSPLAASLAD